MEDRCLDMERRSHIRPSQKCNLQPCIEPPETMPLEHTSLRLRFYLEYLRAKKAIGSPINQHVNQQTLDKIPPRNRSGCVQRRKRQHDQRHHEVQANTEE